MPIVDDAYVDDCLRAGRMLPVDRYVLAALTRDVESQFAVQRHVPSELDPVRPALSSSRALTWTQRVQELVRLLFDEKTLDRSLVELGVDVRKVQTLTPADIKAAYVVLREVETSVQAAPGTTKAQHDAQYTCTHA